MLKNYDNILCILIFEYNIIKFIFIIKILFQYFLFCRNVLKSILTSRIFLFIKIRENNFSICFMLENIVENQQHD